MTGWLARFEPGDRRWMAGGAIAAVAILVAGLIWWPLQQERARLAERVDRQRQTLDWMQAASRRIAELDAPPARAGAGDGQSLLSLVDAGVRRHGFEEQLRRAEPAGEGRVRLWLAGVSFQALAEWLENLQRRHGVTVEELRLERTGEGSVDAQLVMKAAGGN